MTKRPKSNGIERHIVVQITGLVFTLLVGLAMVSAALQTQRIKEQVADELQVRADRSLVQLENRLSFIKENVGAFASRSIVINGMTDASGRSDYLPAAIRDFGRSPEITTVGVFDFAGRLIHSTGSTSLEGPDLDLRPALARGRAAILTGATPGSIVIVAPIMYYGTPQGCIAVEVALSEVLGAVPVDADHGIVVTLPGGWTEVRGAELEDVVSTVQAPGDDLPFLQEIGLSLETRTARDVTMQPVVSALQEHALVGFVALLLSFFVARRLGKRLARPIQKLTTQVTLGHHPCAPVGASDELEILAERLDAQRESLLHSNLLLEERVVERTRELEVQAERLQRSNADLEQFAYISSHDLQEPLRMITSYSQLIRGRCADMLDEKSLRQFDYVTEGAQRMQALLDALLRYARVNSKAGDLTILDCNEIIQNVQKDLEVSSLEASAVIVVEELPNVRGDATQVRQLFQNLIANGIKFRSDHIPRIEISAERTDADECTFHVRDNGIGMDPGYSTKIFQMFQRLHGREEYPGSGVGLTIAKRVVERHGGRIWVESKPGEGSVFSFTLAPPTSEKPKVAGKTTDTINGVGSGIGHERL